jgi:hypothetical protein
MGKTQLLNVKASGTHKLPLCFKWLNKTNEPLAQTSLKYEDGCLLGCSAVLSGGSLPTFPSVIRATITLMMEAASTSETSVNLYQKTATFILTTVRT